MPTDEKKPFVKIPITGLWRNATEQGSTYLSGNLGNARIMIFSNGFKKEGTKQPDYIMYLMPGTPKPKSGSTDDSSGEPESEFDS